MPTFSRKLCIQARSCRPDVNAITMQLLKRKAVQIFCVSIPM